MYIFVYSLVWEIAEFLILGFIISAFLQSLYGLLQFLNVLSSNHSQFKITGSFDNPGPYAGFLASALPITILSFCFLKNSTLSVNLSKVPYLKIGIRVLIVLTIIITFFAILITKSRAAWLATFVSIIYLTFYFFKIDLDIQRKKQLKIKLKNLILRSIAHKYLFVLFINVFVIIFFRGLYQMKKDSADGRLLIWAVTTKMIQDKPILGRGTNGFESNYMNYQADFFKLNANSKYIRLADNNIFAFNEFFRITAEYGLVGLLFILSIIYFIFWGKYQENISIEENLLIIAAKTGIISILVFSLFSYPFEILPLNLNVVLFIAIISSFQKPIFKFQLDNHWIMRIVGIILIGFSVIIILNTSNIYKAQKKWKLGYTSLQLKAYRFSLKYFEEAYPILNNNGEFLIQYGKALALSGEYKKAIVQLDLAKKYQPNSVVYTTLGDCYKNVGEFDLAEESYIKAFNMVPNRLYAEYLLAKLYFENSKDASALKIAEKIIAHKPKVNSIAVTEIKNEMRRIKKIIENK